MKERAGSAAEAFLDSLKVAGLVTDAGAIAVDGVIPAPMPDAHAVKEKQKDEKDEKGTKTLSVPEDFVVYRCKISDGRIIEIPLPPKFGKADADRLYAFLQTQVDE